MFELLFFLIFEENGLLDFLQYIVIFGSVNLEVLLVNLSRKRIYYSFRVIKNLKLLIMCALRNRNG